MFSAESEYISAASAMQEINLLINLLSELDMPQQLLITFMDDNQSAIKPTKSDNFIPRRSTYNHDITS